MTMFRCQKNYVPIKLKTSNFQNNLEITPTNDKQNLKFVRNRESGFLDTGFFGKTSDIYRDRRFFIKFVELSLLKPQIVEIRSDQGSIENQFNCVLG